MSAKTKSEVGVWTEDLCEILGGCDRCTGRARAGAVGLTQLDPDALVFCTHWCHLKHLRE